MSREKEFVKNALILALGNILPKLLVFITLPIMTDMLSKDDYGTYDLAVSLCSLALPAVTLQIQSAAFRFLIDARGDLEKTNSIISNILAFTALSSLVGFGLVYILTYSFSNTIRLLIAIYCFVDIYMLTFGMIARGLGKNNLYATGSIINGTTNAVLIFLFLLIFKTGLNGVLYSSIIACVVAATFYAISNSLFKHFSLRHLDKKLTGRLLSYSWPMVPNNLSRWVLQLSDRVVIVWALGVEANAIYAVANKIPAMLGFANSVLSMSWQENASIAKNDTDADKYYSDMFDKMFRVLSCAFLWISALSPMLFIVLVKGAYEEAYPQISILLMASFFNIMSSFQGGIYVAHMKTKNVGITTIASAVINLIVNVLLINIIGIWAASISTLVAYMVLFAYRMFNVRTFQKINYNFLGIGILLVLLAFSAYLSTVRQLWSGLISLAVALSVSILLLKDLYIPLLHYAAKILRRGRGR